MKLYLDDVNFDTIKKVADIYPIDGITSNPSVLKKSGKTPVEQLRSVREFIGQDKMLMSQVVSTTAEDMIKEARVLQAEAARESPSHKKLIKKLELLEKVTDNVLDKHSDKELVEELRRRGYTVTATISL